jgi:hypothetical protein
MSDADPETAAVEPEEDTSSHGDESPSPRTSPGTSPPKRMTASDSASQGMPPPDRVSTEAWRNNRKRTSEQISIELQSQQSSAAQDRPPHRKATSTSGPSSFSSQEIPPSRQPGKRTKSDGKSARAKKDFHVPAGQEPDIEDESTDNETRSTSGNTESSEDDSPNKPIDEFNWLEFEQRYHDSIQRYSEKETQLQHEFTQMLQVSGCRFTPARIYTDNA